MLGKKMETLLSRDRDGGEPVVLPARSLRLLLLFSGVIAVLLWASVASWPGSIVGKDLDQHRLDQPLPVLDKGVRIRHSFVPSHDGLAEIEVQLARYRNREGSGQLHLSLRDEQGQVIAEERLNTDSLSHNQKYALRFPSQSDSAGRRYTLDVSGTGNNPFSLWGYSLPVYQESTLEVEGAETAVSTLTFVTRYRLTIAVAMSMMLNLLWEKGEILLLASGYLFVPGCLLLTVLARPWRHIDPAVWLGTALALSLAIWALSWYWLTLLGGRWSGMTLWLVLLIGWVGLLALSFRMPQRCPFTSDRWRWEHVVLLLILLGGLAVRLLAVRDLLFPPWVDSVRHALITALMVEKGGVIYDYYPLLPLERFPYHFGFHTIPAGLIMITGWSLPDTLLILGQLLNALVPLALYSAAWLMTRNRAVGLVAAFLVAFPFLFPAYYATWGRYTQLTGMLILPILVALTWQLLRGARVWRESWWLIGLLAAGLFLVHLRVFIYYLPFPLILWIASRGRRTAALLAAGALTVLFVGTRAWYLMPRSNPVETLTTSSKTYNRFPVGYLTVGWEQLFIGLAMVGLAAALGGWLFKRRWTGLPLALAAWSGLLCLMLSGSLIGLPASWLVNFNSMYITLFFPLAIVLGVVAGQVWKLFAEMGWYGEMVRYSLLGVLVTACLLFGVRQQLTILNPQTILALPQDLAGLRWIDEQLPADARIAVSSWRWLGATWSATDGGAWLLPITGRSSTTPPADYSYDPALKRKVEIFNEQAEAVEDWSAPETATWLQRHGVTHLFIGARGGFLDPVALQANPGTRQLYAEDGVYIFEVTGK